MATYLTTPAFFMTLLTHRESIANDGIRWWAQNRNPTGCASYWGFIARTDRNEWTAEVDRVAPTRAASPRPNGIAAKGSGSTRAKAIEAAIANLHHRTAVALGID